MLINLCKQLSLSHNCLAWWLYCKHGSWAPIPLHLTLDSYQNGYRFRKFCHQLFFTCNGNHNGSSLECCLWARKSTPSNHFQGEHLNETKKFLLNNDNISTPAIFVWIMGMHQSGYGSCLHFIDLHCNDVLAIYNIIILL